MAVLNSVPPLDQAHTKSRRVSKVGVQKATLLTCCWFVGRHKVQQHAKAPGCYRPIPVRPTLATTSSRGTLPHGKQNNDVFASDCTKGAMRVHDRPND